MVEIAFFPINDIKTEATGVVNPFVGEEFSSLLASFMPQAGPEASLGRQTPAPDGFAAAGVDKGHAGIAELVLAPLESVIAVLEVENSEQVSEGAVHCESETADSKLMESGGKEAKAVVTSEDSSRVAPHVVNYFSPAVQRVQVEEGAVLKTQDEPEIEGHKLIKASGKEDKAAVRDHFAPSVQTTQVDEGVKVAEQVFSSALIKAQEPIESQEPVSADKSSEAAMEQGAVQTRLTSLSKDESISPEKIEVKAHAIAEHLKAEAIDEKMLDRKAVEPTEKSIAASPDEEAVFSAEVFSSRAFEPSGEVQKGPCDIGKAADSEVAGVTAFFSKGFEDHEPDKETSFDGSEQPLGQEPFLKAENVIPGAAFGKHLETAVERPLAPVALGSPAPAEVKDRVEAGIRLSVESGGGEVRMKLNPESLGEVRIKLDVSSGVVKAEIVVERHEVKTMIEADSAFLKDALSSHGLTLDKCVVEVAKPFDAKARFESSWQDLAGEERASSGHKEHKDRGSSGWHGRFNQERRREKESGVDFFV